MPAFAPALPRAPRGSQQRGPPVTLAEGPTTLCMLWCEVPTGIKPPALRAQWYDKPAPKTAQVRMQWPCLRQCMYGCLRPNVRCPRFSFAVQMRLPLGPHGANGTEKYAAYLAETKQPGSILRPATAPAGKGKK